jgi:putative Mg2+ transporter-C (MgtC) family protein
MEVELHIIGRLLAAAALGGAIGAEREIADHPAGIRTHLTVALGAALFGIISTIGFLEFEQAQRATNIQFDVTRVASTVVTGVGFLGAGIIFRRGNTVHNLTTAGSLWVVAAIGLSCGIGDVGVAAVTGAVLLVGLVALRWPRDWVRNRISRTSESVRVLLQADAHWGPVEDELRGLEGIEVFTVNLEKEDGAFVVAARMEAKAGVDLRARLSAVARRDDVRTMTLGAPVPTD